MTSRKFHALLTPTFCYLFYFKDHTYSASLELVILSLVLRLSPPSSATCPPVWALLIPPSLPLVVAFVTLPSPLRETLSSRLNLGKAFSASNW